MTEILATEATLSTLSVEIKALTLRGRQLTLAGFRQFPLAQALDTWWDLREEVMYWGLVRYAIKDQGDLWAVMEQDGKLYRGCVTEEFAADLVRRWKDGDGDVPEDLREAYYPALRRQEWYSVPSGGQRRCTEDDDTLRAVYQDWQGRRNLAAEIETFKAVCASYRQKHAESIGALRSLSQLFIAV